jgi:hypothetical protein
VRRMRVAAPPVLAAVLAGGTVAGLSAGAGPASVHALSLGRTGLVMDATRPGWCMAARITVPGKLVVMQSIAVVGADDAWAAGFAAGRGTRSGQPVIERWSGRSWERVEVPGTALTAFHRGPAGPSPIVDASSARNVWVFNQVTGAWLHWNGSRWSHGRLPAPPGSVATPVTSELVLGSRDVWAFGASVDRNGNDEPYAARFDGHRWLVTPMPKVPNLLVSAASAVRPGDIWATIGYGGQIFFPPQGNGGALARWNGRRWHLEPLPARFARHGDPTSIAARTGSGVWVGGGIEGRSVGLAEAAAHWNGSAWRVAAVPAAPSRTDCVFRAVVPDRAGQFALGDCFSSLNGHVWSRLWRRSASAWFGPFRPRLAGTQPVFLDLASAERAGLVWAAGYAQNAGIIALSGPASG